MKTVEIRELGNTFGCAGGGKGHYGFRNLGLAQRTETYLGMAGGHAVEMILEAGVGTIVDTSPSAYGGQVRTIQIDVAVLDKICDAYWDRVNGASVKSRSSCHYCGMPAVDSNFFGEPVCQECGG